MVLLPSFLVKFLIVVGIGAVAYYGWVFFQTKKVTAELVRVQDEIAAEKASVSGIQDRDELLTRQLQLQSLDKVIAKHAYWTHVLPELANVTLRSATYSNIKATAEGVISLSGKVPTLEELDKFLQVFNLPEYSANFNMVRLGSYHVAQEDEGTSVSFEIKMNYNTGLLKYNPLLKKQTP